MRLTLEPDVGTLIARVSALLSARGVRAWATGGFLRDSILGRTIGDIDLTIDGDPLDVGRVVADDLGGHYVVLDAERRHVRIARPDGPNVDITPLRAADITGDLRQRDFTINAMAVDLPTVGEEFELLDSTSGMEDLHDRSVRMIAEQRLVDDPLRLLRGVRIATQLEFALETETAGAIRRQAASILDVAPERQREEIARIFSTDRAGAGVRLLEELGLFAHVFQEMVVTRGVEQPKEHTYDVLGHCMAAVEYLDVVLAEDEQSAPRYESLPNLPYWRVFWDELAACEGLREYLREPLAGDFDRRGLLKFCGLLHDIGKPATKSFEANGRMRFFGHSDAGAKLAAKLMRRLRFSSREVSMVKAMIEAHLRPLQMAQSGGPSRRAVYKFFRDTGEAGIETLILSIGDHLATVAHRVNPDHFRQHAALIAHIIRTRFEDNSVVSPPRLVDGDDLMAAFGLEPGETVGRLLEAIRESQAAGEVIDREEALALAGRMLDASEGAPRANLKRPAG